MKGVEEAVVAEATKIAQSGNVAFNGECPQCNTHSSLASVTIIATLAGWI